MNKIRNALLGSFAVIAAATMTSAPAVTQQQPQKPNILIIWGDDIGTFNVSAYLVFTIILYEKSIRVVFE